MNVKNLMLNVYLLIYLFILSKQSSIINIYFIGYFNTFN